MSTIGFVGMGHMGLPMAENLVRAGHTVRGHDVASAALEAAAASGVVPCAALEDCLTGADLVVTMVPDGTIMLDVLERILAAAGGGGPPVVDCSTVDLADARRAHARAAVAATGFLDAPVSGGVGGAAAGTLTLMVGGDAALLERVTPALEAIASRIVRCGDAGAGQAAKLCNNLLLATSMIGTCEAFALGDKLGLDPATLFEVLATSTGACWSVTGYCPVPDVGPRSPADDGYRPGFPARLMVKDMTLAQRAAESVAQATPLGRHALELYREFVAAGGEETDFSGIIEHLARRARD